MLATLQTGDSVDGLAGNDVLHASLTGLETIPTIQNVENFNITAFEDTTFNFANIVGVQFVNSIASVGLLSCTNLNFVPSFSITDSITGLATQFSEGTLTNNDDAFELSLDNVSGGTVAIDTGNTDGFEIVYIVSEGDTPNRLTGIQQIDVQSVRTMFISGATQFSLDMPLSEISSVESRQWAVDAGMSTGGVTINAGTARVIFFGSSGDDVITGGSNRDIISTRSGRDTVRFTGLHQTSFDSDQLIDFEPGDNGDIILLDISDVGNGIIAELQDDNIKTIADSASYSFIIGNTGMPFSTFSEAEEAVNKANPGTQDYALMFYNNFAFRIELYIDADSSESDGGVLLASFDIPFYDDAEYFLRTFSDENYNVE